MRVQLIVLLLLAAASLLSQTANADVLRCNDTNGNTLYTDSACPPGTRVVGSPSILQSCASEDCERRRERALSDARERLRTEKEQAAAYAAERHQREIDYRWLDQARYEAQLRSVEANQASYDEGYYPAYSYGTPGRCGARCFAVLRHPHVAHTRIANGGTGHRHGKFPDELRGFRAGGNEPRHSMRGTTSGNRARVAINLK